MKNPAMPAAESPTVLVIEDEEDLRGALRLTLERGKLTPVLCGDGRSGLKALYDVRPDAVVLDIGLPDIDGWEVLERIRDMSDVPVLLLTARNLEFEKVRGLQAGADDYLTKPFGNAELVGGRTTRSTAFHSPSATSGIPGDVQTGHWRRCTCPAAGWPNTSRAGACP